jgi:hypothetical protein
MIYWTCWSCMTMLSSSPYQVCSQRRPAFNSTPSSFPFSYATINSAVLCAQHEGTKAPDTASPLQICHMQILRNNQIRRVIIDIKCVRWGSVLAHRGHIPHSLWSKNLIYPKRQNVDLGCESEIALSKDIHAWNNNKCAAGNISVSRSWGIEYVQEHLHHANIIICVSEIY